MRVLPDEPMGPQRVTDLADGFRSNRLSFGEYLNNLKDAFAAREPLINAFIPEPLSDRFERCRRDFGRLEIEFPEPSSRPRLFGIALGVKDIFRTDGFPTRAGSRLPPELFQGLEADCVTRLKCAGAVILGKTVTTEFAYFAPGPTRNPHDLEHTPGGSSSGSAASVGAGLCPLALGTQTIGSVLRPASYCGVIGFKPTYGRVSLEGIIPLSPSVDHVGFFTVDVDGAIRAASVLCEGWRKRNGTPARIFGVPEGPYVEHTSDFGLKHFRETCRRLVDAGCDIQSIEMLTDFEEIVENHRALVAGEAAMVHRRWFQQFSNRYHEKTVELIREGQSVSSELLEACRRGREKLRAGITDVMKSHRVSALLTPAATGPAPHGLSSTGDPIMNLPWTHAGVPALNIPSGKSAEGLPLGLQLVGPWMDDESLLDLAKEVSEALDYPLT